MALQFGLSINSAGEAIAVAGTGNSTVVGTTPVGFFPVDSQGRLIVQGLGAGGGSSYTPPVPIALTASRTLTTADNGATLYYAGTTDITVTVPSGLGAGFSVAFAQNSTGKIIVAAGSGATVNNRQNYVRTAGQYAVMSLVQTTANAYILAGDGAV